MNVVKVDDDTYRIIQLTKDTLGVTEEKAVIVLTEIGLLNILSMPLFDGKTPEVLNPITYNLLQKLNKKLSEGKFPELVKKIKEIWAV